MRAGGPFAIALGRCRLSSHKAELALELELELIRFETRIYQIHGKLKPDGVQPCMAGRWRYY